MSFLSILSEIFQALVQGFFLSIGILLGVLLLILLFRGRQDYDPDELKIAFTDYLRRMQDEEQYELFREVQFIIAELGSGRLPKHLVHYRIKPEVSIKLDEAGESKMIRLVKSYRIMGINTGKK